MASESSPTRSTRIEVRGDLTGQLAVGDDNQLIHTSVASPLVTDAEREQLTSAFADLRAAVERTAPAERQQAAQERIAELEEAVTADKPDLTTMEYVRRWFARNLPGLAGAVTSIIVDPIVGRLVAAAGDVLAADFDRRFGR